MQWLGKFGCVCLSVSQSHLYFFALLQDDGGDKRGKRLMEAIQCAKTRLPPFAFLSIDDVREEKLGREQEKVRLKTPPPQKPNYRIGKTRRRTESFYCVFAHEPVLLGTASAKWRECVFLNPESFPYFLQSN